ELLAGHRAVLLEGRDDRVDLAVEQARRRAPGVDRGAEHPRRVERVPGAGAWPIPAAPGPLALERPPLALAPAVGLLLAIARDRLVGVLFGAGERALLRLFGGERLRDVLERRLLGLHAEEELRDAAERHHAGADQEGDHHPAAVVRRDQVAEEQRADDPAEP